jgi:Fur family ferric uptake transcriptional regulator
MVLEAVRESDGHISADEILARVHAKYPYANISTIYRTLELLKRLRLVTETDLGEGRVRYHYAENGRHHHLICQRCGAVADMADSDMSPLEDMLHRKYGFRADLRHLAIFGRCRQCRG